MDHLSPEQLADNAKKIYDEFLKKGSLSTKDRLQIPQQDMPSQSPKERIKNMNEVTLGYTEEQAIVEANRCLQCSNAPCIQGCPVRINIPKFIKSITEKDFAQAAAILKENSLLPAVCGRVCPQEVQCQAPCTVGKVLKDPSQSVSIGRLERFVSDWERANSKIKSPQINSSTGKKVAIIGSGPAGITAAADIKREGHEVTVFEAFHKPGGVMIYGIPEFRLPKNIVEAEIETLIKMGVKIQTNFVVGRTRKLMDLFDKDGYDAIFIGTGAGLPKFMGIEGENSIGVFSANEFLTRVNLMKAFDLNNADTPIYPSRIVVVLGGGNVAMDVARSALRLGAKEVHLVYRRTEAEMPARVEEVFHAKEEGVIFHTLQNVQKIISDEHGCTKAVQCLKYDLGEKDSSGRPRPVPIQGSEFIMDADTVIVAIGNGSNPLIKKTSPELKVNREGNIITNEKMETSIDGVFAGGDIVLGAATVILAMGQGRIAANAINEYLKKR